MLKDNVQDNFYDILILDDEPFILDIFSHFLADRGFNVQVTSSASQAITYLTDSKFDLVMLDVNLKYGNFSDILSEVKETIYSDIPIIAVTGAPDLISKSDLNLLHAVLEKPFTPEELLNFIRQEMNWVIP